LDSVPPQPPLQPTPVRCNGILTYACGRINEILRVVDCPMVVSGGTESVSPPLIGEYCGSWRDILANKFRQGFSVPKFDVFYGEEMFYFKSDYFKSKK